MQTASLNYYTQKNISLNKNNSHKLLYTKLRYISFFMQVIWHTKQIFTMLRSAIVQGKVDMWYVITTYVKLLFMWEINL